MSDPVTGLSISLQNMKSTLEVLKWYQRATNDLTLQSFITSLQTTYNSNVGSAAVEGMRSIPAQSADGLTGTGN